MTGQTSVASHGKIALASKQERWFSALNSFSLRRNSPRLVANQLLIGNEAWLTLPRQPGHLKLTLLGSALLHIIAIGLLGFYFSGQAGTSESRVPTLSVVLPQGSVSTGEAFSTHAQSTGSETRSFTRKYFQRTEAIPESDWPEPFDTSPYADPENIDSTASVIEAPELPLPPSRDISSGLLRIKIFVNEYGMVDQIELIETSLQEDYSNRLIQAFKESKFSPGLLHGEPVKSWRMVEIDYIDP